MEETILFRKDWDPNLEFFLSREEISHLKALRIYSEKKILRVLDGIGSEWVYEVEAGANRGILKKTVTHPKPNRISGIATAIPKGNRLEWLLQKGTELGLTHFYFLNFEQSDRKDFNLERAQKIAEEAASQSKQIFLPEVYAPVSLKEFLKSKEPQSCSFYFLDPRGESGLKPEYFRDAIWIVGPEGGFREKEIDLLKERNVLGVKAGDSILRIETAGIFAASMFRYFTY
ncbi:16S rRNA (uracil(1498)-N(3))-methyltransferase [Leptospira adleri]|uniref:Ribosomal RNA small subunit methyltransferase E n=1 Tax=Leptospira adleri TaxID=2023186 RepID=A0A2M9YUE5_9LEPT|nr:16S rRNA (uracil(1498)-N(3))-methyltransferase [Leptospira adleri]PJZ55162.1 16S rRNA (uracil(1498)-N(3))-methyltransferase [Leptospira adleri]PJZ63454.1 16S rRNA (uracil(1498)-N(3))-methyltransferase [Leptospira adleri]